MPAEKVCRKMSISDATFYNWKKQGGLVPLELRRLRQLEEKNSKLKRLVVDFSRQDYVQDVIVKKALKPSHKPILIDELHARYRASSI